MRGERRRSSLTGREREVLDLVRVGLTNEEIAGRLGITLDGAKYHVSQILAKLGVASREEAAVVAVRESWWQRLGAWGLAAKIALAAATAGAVGGIALLALGVALSGTGDVRAQTYVGQIGSFRDTNNFVAFAQQMADAVQRKDVGWFLDKSANFCAIGDTSCSQGVARGVSFNSAFHGETQEAGNVIGNAYSAYLTSFFDSQQANKSDQFGSGAASLFAIGASPLPPNFPSPNEGGPITTIISAIVENDAASLPSSPPLTGRAYLILITYRRDGDWIIQELTVGDENDHGGETMASVLSPGGPPVRTNGTIPEYSWSYWQRWPLATPSP
jgi:DNA-binding CsgD family transcriptional regulator